MTKVYELIAKNKQELGPLFFEKEKDARIVMEAFMGIDDSLELQLNCIKTLSLKEARVQLRLHFPEQLQNIF